MMLNIKLKTKEDIEHFILIINIGIATAIKEDLISIEEAEKFLYNPYSVKKIRSLGINEEIVSLIELGCELEDVESIIPDKLNNSIDEIRNRAFELLRIVKKPLYQIKKWID